jgi:hypothetical protein
MSAQSLNPHVNPRRAEPILRRPLSTCGASKQKRLRLLTATAHLWLALLLWAVPECRPQEKDSLAQELNDLALEIFPERVNKQKQTVQEILARMPAEKSGVVVAHLKSFQKAGYANGLAELLSASTNLDGLLLRQYLHPAGETNPFVVVASYWDHKPQRDFIRTNLESLEVEYWLKPDMRGGAEALVRLKDVPMAVIALSHRPPPGSYVRHWVLYSYPFRDSELQQRQRATIETVLSREPGKNANQVKSGLLAKDPNSYQRSLARMLLLLPSEEFPTFEIFPELCEGSTNWLLSVFEDKPSAPDYPVAKLKAAGIPFCIQTNDVEDLRLYVKPHDFAQAVLIASQQKAAKWDRSCRYRWELLAYPFRPDVRGKK